MTARKLVVIVRAGAAQCRPGGDTRIGVGFFETHGHGHTHVLGWGWCLVQPTAQ